MNRSILIVICDFLLLSLVTFSTDLGSIIGQDEGVSTVKADVVMRTPENHGKELAAVMKQALLDEQSNREKLEAELTKYRNTTRQLDEQAAAQVREQAQQLQQLKLKETELEKQYVAAQASVQTLTQKLQTSASEGTLTKEKLAAREAELNKQKAIAAGLQQQIELLNARLHSAESEKTLASGQIAMMRQQMDAEQAQNLRLADNYKALANRPAPVTKVVQESGPLAANTIFDDFVKNRVQATFNAFRTGMLGVDSTKNKTSHLVLATDGANIYAVCHVQETPFTLAQSATDWRGITGILSCNQAQVAIRSLSFHVQDPRVIFMPVSKADAAELGCKAFPISPDPYKFQDAVLVGAQQGYYGQCSFQIDLNTPEYVKLVRNKVLFGKFNPSRGDLVFSRGGELLGVMVNDNYCLVLHEFAESEAMAFGPDLRPTRTGEMLSRMYFYAYQLPTRLH
jgi:hypothetical protein